MDSIRTFFSTFDIPNIVTLILTMLAFVFTLYFWLLDHLSEEETKFIESKAETLSKLNESKEKIEDTINKNDNKSIIEAIQKEVNAVNEVLEVIVHYRFWMRSPQRSEYEKIPQFYNDSLYLASTLKRSTEIEKGRKSLVDIDDLKNDKNKIEEIRSNYLDGLLYIISFITNWR